MKTKISSHAHYSAKPVDTNPDYNLSTDVTLDLKTLPKFDFKPSASSTSNTDEIKRKKEDIFENETETKKSKVAPEVCETKSKTSFETLFKDCKKSEPFANIPSVPEKTAKEDTSKFSFAPGVKPSYSLSNAVDVTLKNTGDFQFSRGISPIRASLSSSLRNRSVAKRKNDDVNEKSLNDSEISKSIKSSTTPVVEKIESEVTYCSFNIWKLMYDFLRFHQRCRHH